MKNKISLFSGLLAFCLLIWGFTQCSTQTDLTSSVQPSFESFDVAYETFEVPNEGGTFKLSNGTEIYLPENCFVDKDGNPIDGNVNLKYREFHRPEDVIASGIPMTYQEGGEEGFLVTAGMMEMRGTDVNGNEVFFAENKSADFNMASYLDEEGVDFYALDEATGTWTKTGTPGEQRADPIDALVSGEAEGEEYVSDTTAPLKAPFAPKRRTADEAVVQFESGKGFDEIAGLETVLWRYAGTDETSDPFGYDAFNEDRFKVVRSEIIDAELKTLEVEMEFRYTKGDTIQMAPKSLVTWFAPVLSNSKFEEASAIYADKEAYYRAQMEKRQALQDIENQKALLRRSFSVSNFGYYNCDIFSRAPFIEGEVQFTYQGEAMKNASSVYLVNTNNGLSSTVNQEYSPSGKNYLRILADGTNQLVVILDGDMMGTISQEELDAHNFGQGACSIEVSNAQKVNSLKDVENLIVSL